MRNLKKGIALAMAASLSVCAFAGCGEQGTTTTASTNDTNSTSTQSTAAAEGGKVYYLNFKPENSAIWEELAKTYTTQTGVEVKVQTAASGTYEETLKAEMAKSEAPTLFQVNGPVELKTWNDYCYDLKDTSLFSNLKSNDFALMDGEAAKGIAYVIETYGIIYNKTLLNKYFC